MDNLLKSKNLYALVDCNSFFCSCERLFRPDLIDKPVGVLSNNDGCFVARTPELKALGIKMGEPYFKVKDLCRTNGVTVFSSNFSLYTNISQRVMNELKKFAPKVEVYSVDEAFLDLTGISNIESHILEIKNTIYKNVGIPVSIGVGRTKTLAKIANNLAKKSKKAKGLIFLNSKKLETEALRRTNIGDVWGVGRRSTSKMQSLGINTALDLREYKNSKQILKIFTKIGLQMKEELDGYKRFELELVTKKKKQIMVSRSFGKPVTSLYELKESVANFATSAAFKLRKQESVTGCISVFARTSTFKNVTQYRGGYSLEFLSPTSDTRKIVKAALDVVDQIYKPRIEFKKSGCCLSKIINKNEAQLSLFSPPDDLLSDNLMKAIDFINELDGNGTIIPAACGFHKTGWKMNRLLKSPRYITDWLELRKVL